MQDEEEEATLYCLFLALFIWRLLRGRSEAAKGREEVIMLPQTPELKADGGKSS